MNINKNIVQIMFIVLALLSTGCNESDMQDTAETPMQPTVTPDPYKTAGWYAKTEVFATATDGEVYSHTTAGVFGALVQSDDAKDQHDILGYGSAILQVVFPQTEWAEANGDYFSNYQHFDENSSSKKVWMFQVKNQETVNLADAAITINLKGVYDVQYRDDRGSVEYKESTSIDSEKVASFNLVDVDNSTSYTLEQLTTANLSMNGLHTRTFRWVLGSVDATDYEPLPAPQRAAGRYVTDAFQAAPAMVGGKFGLPPQ